MKSTYLLWGVAIVLAVGVFLCEWMNERTKRARKTEYQRGWECAREVCHGQSLEFLKAQYASSLYTPNPSTFYDGWRDYIHARCSELDA